MSKGRNSLLLTIRLPDAVIEWLSGGLKEGQSVQQRVKELVIRSYEGAVHTIKTVSESEWSEATAPDGAGNTPQNRSVHQAVHTTDLTKIPGVFRGMPPAKEPPPEPEIISNVVRYERGKRYAKGQKVAIYNPRTRQTEIREAPETDAEGDVVWE